MKYPITVTQTTPETKVEPGNYSWTFRTETELLTHFAAGGFRSVHGRRFSFKWSDGSEVSTAYLQDLRRRSVK